MNAPGKREWLISFLLLGLFLLPTEYWCVTTALETQGEVMQGMLWGLAWLNVLWVLLSGWWPRAATIGMLVGALLIVPCQVALLGRLTRLNTEMMRLVDDRLRLRAEGKPIPPTLDDYEFSDPDVKRFVYDYHVEEGGKEFFISYFVVQPGITHSYSSKTGWFYYPD